MAIRDDEVVDVTPAPLTRTESLFIPNIFKGLGTTMRHAFQNFGRNGAVRKNIWVVQYPEQKRDDRSVEDGGQFRDNFRGVHRLNKDEDGRVRCVACMMCAMCEEACPVDAIELTPHYEVTGMTRQELIFDKAKLLQVFDETIVDKPM